MWLRQQFEWDGVYPCDFFAARLAGAQHGDEKKPMGQTQQRVPTFDVHLPVWVHTPIAHTLHELTVCKCKDS